MKKNLVKISSLMMALLICFSFFSCAARPSIDGEDMNWNLVFITYKSAANVVYCAAEYKINYPDEDVETLDLSCSAANGKLVIMNDRKGIGYYGTYETENDGKEPSYSVTVSTDEGVFKGYAEVTKAKLHDDSVEYNLIIVIDGYTLHFKSLDN